jgi:hypothetical protein
VLPSATATPSPSHASKSRFALRGRRLGPTCHALQAPLLPSEPRHVVAYLRAALGGSSYAAVAITGRDVRDGSFTGRDIRNNVRNNSLTGAAPMDITVLMSSNSQNAVVGQPINGGPGSSTSVVIPKNTTKGTFTVQTNDNGLRSGGHTTGGDQRLLHHGHRQPASDQQALSARRARELRGALQATGAA